MSLNSIFSSVNISGSGMSAERTRMEIAANNIANANTTRSANGGPYRRQQVIFAAAMDAAGGAVSGGNSNLQGVEMSGIVPDDSPLPRIYNPGHPDADADGFVTMPNVSLPTEMVDLMTASRAYEANLKSLQVFRQMAEQSLNLMRSTG